jgi:multisubunit Na+/H+ antiporter MnhE subunit
MRRVVLGWVVEAVAWWGLCLGVWVITLSAVPGQELAVATPVSLPCGVLAVAARRAAGSRWRFRPRWLLAVVAVPVAIVSDTFQVFLAAMTRREGHFAEVTVRQGAGDAPLASGRRALATILVTVTPGSIVTDIDTETGVAMVHVLSEGGPRMEEVATR